MKKSHLISLLQIHDKSIPVRIWTFDPDLFWHETDSFELEADCLYKFEQDKMEDILVMDLSTYYIKQTVASLIKELNKTSGDLDVCLLQYNDNSREMYEFNSVSDFSITIKDDYILISC